MALKKRNKVNAVFSMASLTDMIFLLLIFFVLNSSVVAPNALNLKLPGSSKSKIRIDSRTDEIGISPSGNFYLNGKRISPFELEQGLASKSQRSADKMNITISPQQGTPIKFVAFVMDIAMRYEINAILTADK